MSQYHYSSLSLGSDSIRLLRLMPHGNKSIESTKIQCELFEYSLQDQGKGTHLYEALSYVWGSSKKPRSVSINKKNLVVTENLYEALLHLQNGSLERILWVDAICINQENLEEQGQQVQLMAKIYSKATRVLVWLGETAGDREGALEDIRLAANEESMELSKKEMNQQAILNLLQQPWFQRIWVLQEVAAARHVVMMCGSTEIDGYAFCLGLKSLKLPYAASPELQSLPSVVYLIEQAGLRSKYTTNSPKRFSLEIRHLAELVDMFHTREASDVRDKVYALLGMSSDDPGKAGLQPDYKVSWEELFKQLVKFVLSKNVCVETSNQSQRAVIKSKGCILGQVSLVRSDNRQNLNITSKNASWYLGNKREWTFQASAKSIQEGDIICLLQGASKPTIIRLCKDHFAIVVIAATPLNENGSFGQLELSRLITHFPRDFLLVWDWEKPLGELQDQEEYEALTKTNSRVLECSKAEFGDHSDKATRIWNVALILGDIEEYKRAEERLREAIEIAFGKKHLYTLKIQYGLTPLSWAAGNGYNTIVNLLLAKDSVNPDLKDSQYSRTPLSWAADGGHEAIVKLLLETGKVDIDSRDKGDQTPLSRAAEQGHEAVIKLLLKTSKVNVDLKDKGGQTPLSKAAEQGHEAVVKLLLETRKVNVDSKDEWGQTPLWRAAEQGHKAVVKLLLKTDKADVESKDTGGQTPLLKVAEKGHEAIVKLLLETNKVDINSKDIGGQTPLSKAAEQGHEAVVKLLLETSKVDVDLKDKGGQTPLSRAAERGHKAIVKLLLETSEVDINSKDIGGQTPLSKAAEQGHKAVVKLLLETGKVDVDSKDIGGQTPLLKVAEQGHKAIVRLLLKAGKVDVDSKDEGGQTPLLKAAERGYEAIVRLLLKTDKVNVDLKDEGGQTLLSRAAEQGQEAVVKLLLETGKVDVDSKDTGVRTPLSRAAERGHEAIVKLLLETGKVDIDSKDKWGQTPLSKAAEQEHEAVVKLLLETGNVDVDSKDEWGQTPLWRAAERGHEAVVKLLLETGKVDVDSKDTGGQTPLSKAANGGHEAVVKLLRQSTK